MTKINIQTGNARGVLEFETREELDEFVDYLKNDNSRFSDNLNIIANCISKERHNTNSIKDYELIPSIIEALNTHVKNVGSLDKFGSKLTGWIATELIYDRTKDQWETDNGFILTGSLEYHLMWFTKIAPEYWGRK